MTDQWWIAIFTNAVIVIGSLWLGSIRLTAKIGAFQTEIGALLNKRDLDGFHEGAAIRNEIYKATHDFGETISALKQKINDVELFGSNHYVRREGMTELSSSISLLRSEIRSDMARLEQKIDQKT
jgi:uncharacterized small protein (DUF1192 family)